MTKSRTRNTQENSEMDYELLKAHYCNLQDENTILQLILQGLICSTFLTP